MANNNDYRVKQLNDEQRKAYFEILECLREKTVILIDTPSGTGKTFMLTVLAKTYPNTDKVQFITLTNDQVREWEAKNIQARTYCSYIMSNFQLSFEEVTELKNMDTCDNINIFCKLIEYTKLYESNNTAPNIIIVDPYTVVSPIWLLLLYILAFKNHIKLIFVGDKMQPGAMTRSNSRFDNTNNFCLATKLSDLTIDYLTVNMRSSDVVFLNKLSSFRETLEPYSRAGEAEFRFNLRYLLYRLFRSKYFTEERFDTVYMAQFNCDLTCLNPQLLWKDIELLFSMVGTNDTKLCQFPGHLHTLTYHAALGRTVDKDVELCTRRHFDWPIKISANRIYTGLCCVTSESAIHKIHDDQNLSSFLLTEYMETKPNGNEFYYRCKSGVSFKKNRQGALSPDEKNDIDTINWNTVNSIEDFEIEKSTDFLRIKRSLYDLPEPNPWAFNNDIASFAEFIKNNENVVNHTITMINGNRMSEAKEFLKSEYETRRN